MPTSPRKPLASEIKISPEYVAKEAEPPLPESPEVMEAEGDFQSGLATIISPE
jgi:hypothetical protein